jgi:hypothetical protein
MNNIDKTARSIYARINRRLKKEKELNPALRDNRSVSLKYLKDRVSEISTDEGNLTEDQIQFIVDEFFDKSDESIESILSEDDNIVDDSLMIDLYSEIKPDLTPALVNQAQNQGMVLSQQEIDQSLNFAQQSLNNSERLEEVILAMLDYVRKNRIDSAQRINSMLDSTNSDINQINQNMLTNIAETLTNNNSNDERLINSFQAFLAGK